MRAAPPTPRLDLQTLQAEPFRLFFPLAAVLGAAGIAHWVTFASGATQQYLGLFHAVTQMQSFLMAFSAGFLLTAIPKRTGSRPAGWPVLVALATLLPATSVAALLGWVAAAQLSYAVSLVVLALFAARRFVARSSARRPPASFVLVPIGFAAGVAGAVLFALGSTFDAGRGALVLGRALVLEGVFLCLTLGIGGFFLPLALRGEAAADLARTRSSVRAAAGYVLAGAVVLAGLVIDARSDGGPAQRVGVLLRALAAVAVLAASGAWRRPTRPGFNRRLLWAAPWAVPLGLFLAAAFPAHRVAAMHVAYVGGFGLLAFCVAAHVTLGHGGCEREQNGRPWPVIACGALFVAAAALRAVATAWIELYTTWLLAAASVWLVAAVVWSAFLLPKMWGAPVRPEAAA